MFKIGDFSRLSQVSIKALRYYDEIGLLRPARIDHLTSYRYYTADQLPRLNRILALKELGLSLDEIARMLDEGLAVEQMRSLLATKRVEIARQVADEQARLARVEARLRQIEQEGKLPDYEVVFKPVAPLRVAALRATVPTYADGGGLFVRLSAYLRTHGLDPQACYPMLLLYYDAGYVEQNVDTEVAAPVGESELPAEAGIQVYTLPAAATMAAVVHRGPYEAINAAFGALMHWIGANGYAVNGPNRMLYLVGPDPNMPPAEFVTEIQFPVIPVEEGGSPPPCAV